MWSVRKCLELIAADKDTVILYRDAHSKFRLCPSFDAAASLGYRDVQLTVKFVRNKEAYRLGVSNHLCEIQLHLKSLYEAMTEVGRSKYQLLRRVLVRKDEKKLKQF